MKKTGRLVAWLGISSTLLLGCYTSEMIDPTGTEKERIHAREIESVVTRDGTKYEFREPPIIKNDILVGEARIYGTFLPTFGVVTVPMSDVAGVSVSRYNAVKTWIWVGIGTYVVIGCAVAATKNDFHLLKLD
jgi:hypothetical protein